MFPRSATMGSSLRSAALLQILVAGDTNNQYDVFVRDVASGTTILVSTDSGGTQGNRNSRIRPSAMTAATWRSLVNPNNLVAGDADTFQDVYVKDLQTGAITLASVGSSGVKSNSSSYQPSISGDGRYVAFRSGATNLDPGDTDSFDDIFVRDLVNNTTTLVSTSSSGVKSNNSSFEPSVSGDGRYVTFTSRATNLDPGTRTDSGHFRPRPGQQHDHPCQHEQRRCQ